MINGLINFSRKFRIIFIMQEFIDRTTVYINNAKTILINKWTNKPLNNNAARAMMRDPCDCNDQFSYLCE